MKFFSALPVRPSGGNDLYAAPTPDGQFYIYLPLFAVLLTPLASIPRALAIVLWTALNVALLRWTIYAFYEAMTGISLSQRDVRTRWTLCFFTLILSLDFVLNNLRNGQANILVLALSVLALKISGRKMDFAGGMILGISTVIKVLGVPLAAWLFFRRKAKIIAGVVCGVAAGLFLPALFLGVRKKLELHPVLVSKSRSIQRPAQPSGAS